MKKILYFELKKIFKKRIAIISILIAVLLNFMFIISTCRSMYSFDGKNKEGTGLEAVSIDKELAEKYQGTLTDEKVQQMLQDFMPTSDLHGMNVAYLWQNSIQSAVHSHFADMNGNWNGLTVKDVYGDEEIEIGYVDGWLSVSQYMVRVILIISLLMIVLIIPIFAGEYEGVDNIILTSRLGKTECIRAKIIAALFSAFLITTLFLIINMAAGVVLYGTEGLHCSILFAPVSYVENYIPFNITCGTLIFYQSMLAYTCIFSVTGISLFFSAVCRKQMTALIFSLAVFLFPMMLPVAEHNPLYQLLVLLPVYHVQFISLMSIKELAKGMLYAVWAMPVSFLVVMIGILCSKRIFSSHQIV